MRGNYKMTVCLSAILLIVVGTSMTTLTSQEQRKQNPSNSDQRRPSPQEQEQHKNESEKRFPIASYESADPADPEKLAQRKAKNKRYDNARLVSNKPNREDTEVAVYYEGETNLPALPTAMSDVIVVGEVLEAQAHLSNDKNNVYSEFTVRVSEVLKNKGSAPLAPASSITVERIGGFVRYPDGQKILYRLAGKGMPGVGQRYLLFLNTIKGSQEYRILTGYELGSGGVNPLDYAKQFYAYRGHDGDALLKAVFDAIHSY